MDIFEQFGVTAYRTVRARGGYICTTDKGMRLIREYQGNESGLFKQKYITDELERQGIAADSFVMTESGTLLAQDDDGKNFYMKKWVDGHECSVLNQEEIIKGVRLLANVHNAFAKIPAADGISGNIPSGTQADISGNMSSGTQADISAEIRPDRQAAIPSGTQACMPAVMPHMKPISEVFAKRIKELNSAKNYLKSKNKKNLFEEAVYSGIDRYMHKARTAQQLYKDQCIQEDIHDGICHGSYNYHNIIICGNNSMVVNYSKACMGKQVNDLYDYLRKMMEKNDWSVSLGIKICDEYDKIRKMTEQEKKLLAVLILFPEKYWKIVNHYYNSNKAWFPDKDMEKLRKVIKQESQANFFGEKFAYHMGLW